MIREELNKYIRKLAGELKDSKELTLVLKARLTKREYKMLLAWAEDSSKEMISGKLKLDNESYARLSQKLIKKLNQEKLKQELVV